jgi:hypothetical protein
MKSLAKTLRNFAVLLAAALGGVATQAQAQSQCGLTGISAAATPLVYDPFNPSGFSNNNIVLNISRVNPPGGGTTSVLNFYLKPNALTGANANGIQLIPVSISGGNGASLDGAGLNIFYSLSEPTPTLLPINIMPSSGNRFAKVSFTGNNLASNTVAVTFQVIMPPNLQLQAIQSLSFDAGFSCNIQGGQYNGETQTGERANAVTFPVTVLSALRTYYAGTALDFGEIGAITTGSLPGNPQKTNPSNHVFVQSSGAYSVTLSSQNAFKLFKPGAAVANDKIDYRLRFLGMEVDNGTVPTPGATAITRSCIPATLATTGNVLPIQAKLLEGGSGKNPSPTYSDILTITVTPLAYSDPGINSCSSYNLSGF